LDIKKIPAIIILVLICTLKLSAAENKDINFIDNEFYLKGDTDNFLLQYIDKAKDNPDFLRFAASINIQLLSDPFIAESKLQKLVAESKNEETKNIARKILAEIKYATGKFSEGEDLQKQRGVIGDWSIVGPFGKYERADFYNTFEPEKNGIGQDEFKALGREIKWRRLEGAGFNDFRPWSWVAENRGVVYLYTEFFLPEDSIINLNVETVCAFKLIVDGRHAVVSDKIRTPEPYRTRITAGADKKKTVYNKGWHSLLIKLYSRNRNGNIEVSLTDDNNRRVEGIKFGSGNQISQNAEGFSLKTDLSEYQKLSDSSTPDTNFTKLVYQAEYWRNQGCYDLSLEFWNKAVKIKNNSATMMARKAECERAAVFLPEAKRESLAYRSNIQALKLDEKCVPALVALGEYESRNHNYRKADEYYLKALKINPDSLLALLARYRIAKDNGWDIFADNILELIEKKFPNSLSYKIISATRKNMTIPQMAKKLEELCRVQRDKDEIIINTISAYLSAGMIGEAQRIGALFSETSLKNSQVLKIKARIMLAKGEYSLAAKLYSQAAEASGGNADNLKLEGYCWMLSKDNDAREKALHAFKECLKNYPQEHEIRRLVSDLENSDYAFWNKYAVDVQKKINEYLISPKPTGKTARLIDQTILTVYPDGSYANYTHELQNILSSSGVKEAAVVDTYGELITAQTILPKRKLTLEPVILPGQEKITMPALAVGAFTEHAYLQEQPAPSDYNLYFPRWFFRSPDSEESFLFSQYIVRVKPGAAFNYATGNFNGKIKFTKTREEDGTEVYTWTGTNMPKAIHEEGSLAITEQLPFTAIGGDSSWDGVNNLLVNYYVSRVHPTFAIRKKARELVKDSDSEYGRIESIYEFVCREIEDTSAVSPASYILDQRSGDRVLLLMSLLNAAGIKNKFVAIRPSENLLFKPVWKIPSTGIFTEFIVLAIDKDGKKYWLDPRYKYGKANQILEDIAGATAYIVNDKGGDFSDLPPADPAQFEVYDKREYEIKNKNIEISGEKKIPGLAGIILKQSLDNAKKKVIHAAVERLISSGLSGLELMDYSLPGLADNNTDFICRYKAKLYDVVVMRNDNFRGIATGLSELPLLPRIDFTNRRTDYHLKRYINENDNYVLKLPVGVEVRLPENILLKTKFGHYSLSFVLEDNKVIIKRSCFFKPQRVSIDDWNDFYKVAKDIQEAEKSVIWWN